MLFFPLFKIFIYSFNFWLVGFWLVGVSVIELDKLAVGIVGGFLGDDGEAASDAFRVPGQKVRCMWQVAAFHCGDALFSQFRPFRGLFDGQFVVESQGLDALSDLVVDVPHLLLFLCVVHAVF